MSVLVKGMEMPTRCAVCVLCDLRYGTKCKITKMSYYDSEGYPRGGYNGRPDWCPLVEVPAPHGRLIDADALIARMESDAEQMEEPIAQMFTYAAISDVKHSETVIEAEDGDAE